MSDAYQRFITGEISYEEFKRDQDAEHTDFLAEVSAHVDLFGFDVDVRLDIDTGNARIVKREGRRIVEQFKSTSTAGRHHALKAAYSKWLAVYGGES